MRTILIMGNWKMNGSSESIRQLVDGIEQQAKDATVEYAVCAPAVYLSLVKGMLQNVHLGAQDVSVHDHGAYTGEIAADMLTDIGCEYVIVGHSERRQYHGESSEVVAQKALQAQKNGLKPVICIGETLEQREAEQTEAVLAEQLKAVFNTLTPEQLQNAVIAYEPVWAIGTGLAATAEQVQSVHSFIRSQLAACQADLAQSTRILYGGSLKPANAPELLALEDVDGGLIGGASLKSDDFIKIGEAG